jgi:crossover junction endodeoxyribonuclease RusA
MTAITLPWPSPKLSPNARCHWAVKSPITKAARLLARYATEATGARVEHDGPVALRVTFHAPDKRHRDRDNCIAACKAYMDGLADGLGVNDRRFEPTYAWGDAVRGGAVVVTL